MSFKDFQEAKKNLSFSQSLVDKMRGEQNMQNMALQSPEVEEPLVGADTGVDTTPEESPNIEAPEEVSEREAVIEGVVEELKPMFEDLKDRFAAKKDEPQEAVLKVEGTLEPKDSETAS